MFEDGSDSFPHNSTDGRLGNISDATNVQMGTSSKVLKSAKQTQLRDDDAPSGFSHDFGVLLHASKKLIKGFF